LAKPTKVVVALLGARMHYAVPRLLERAGVLARFFTDICGNGAAGHALRLVPRGLRPRGLTALLQRVPEELPESRVVGFDRFGLEYARRRHWARTPTALTEAHLWAGRTFCSLILRHGLGDADAVYAFNSAALELLRAARQRGLRAFLEQTIAPRAAENRILAEERTRWPGWEAENGDDAAAEDFAERERDEWAAAQVVVCGSDFVRQSISECQGPTEKCVVVPYGVDLRPIARPRRARAGPLRVLTVGAVGLRKGSPYVLEAARRLSGIATFRMAGPVGVPKPVERDLRGALDLVGPVPRQSIGEHYAWADVMLLPSLCEGSATVTYEALAHGLPVICTPNAGSIVRDGEEGFIVGIADVEAIAAKIEKLATDRQLLDVMSASALRRARFGSLEGYGERLIRALTADLPDGRS